MKERWKQLAALFDAKAPRERLAIAACVIAVLVYGYATIFIAPLLAAKARLTQQIAQSRASLHTFETLVKTPRAAVDPAAARRAHRDTLRAQIGNLENEMQGLQKTLVPPQQVPELLEGVLARHRNLQLVSLHKLPVQRLTPAPAQPTAKAADATGTGAAKDGKGTGAERAIYQHGFEITVQGSYSDLHDYLAQLEKLPWQMFWGSITVDAGGYPQLTATIRVHTLSLDKAWLIV